jgi:hypothetical protein
LILLFDYSVPLCFRARNATSIAFPNPFLCPSLGHRRISASPLDLEDLRPALDTIKDAGIVYGDVLFRYDFDNLL